MAPILCHAVQLLHGGDQIRPGFGPNLRVGLLAFVSSRIGQVLLSGREYAADSRFAVAARITTIPAPVIQPDCGEAVRAVGRIGPSSVSR